MKKLIHESRERRWYLVREWITRNGLKARVHECVWKVSTLPPHYCGYVECGDFSIDTEKIDVHGGVTFGPDKFQFLNGESFDGTWIGFDTAHLGDENKDLYYVSEECEKMAAQIKRGYYRRMMDWIHKKLSALISA